MIRFGNRCRPVLYALMLSILLVGFTIIPVIAGNDDEITIEKVSISQIVDEVIDYYNGKEITSWEEIVALKLAGEDLAQYNIGKWDPDSFDFATDYATVMLAGLALGQDIADYNGEKLIDGLQSKQLSDGSFDNGVNSTIWSIIALDEASNAGYDEAKYDVESAVDFLINQQKNDGGYAFSDGDGDPDLTGDALLALAKHPEIPGTSEAMDAAIGFLEAAQLETAGFASWGSENSQSIAKVIMGLLAVDEDPVSEKWIKNDRTMLDALLEFQLADSSFKFLADGDRNDMATRQVFRALVELKNAGHEDFEVSREIRDATQEPEKTFVTVRVRVEGHTQSLADEVVTISGTALDALKAAVGEAEVDAPGGFINQIRGEGGREVSEELSTSWMYYLMRDGMIDAEAFNYGAGDYNVKDADEVVFYIGALDKEWNSKTYFPIVSISPSIPAEGEALVISIATKKYAWPDGLSSLTGDEVEAIGEYFLTLGAREYVTVNGKLTIPSLEAAAYPYTITNHNEAGYPNVVTAKGCITINAAENPVEEPGGGDTFPPELNSKVRVYVEVTGKGKTYYSGTVELSKDRSSAIDALAATGVSYRVRDGGYVYEIAGEKEDLSTTAGWKYKVGSQIPGSSASDYILKDGDNLLWFWAGDYTSTDPSEDVPERAVEDELEEQEELPVTEEVSSTITKAIKHFEDAKGIHTVIGSDNPMSEKEKAQLQEILENNTVAIKQKVAARDNTTVTDAKNEVSLTIVKDALSADKIITIREIAKDELIRESKDYKQLTSVFEFGPKGTTFEEPVYLSIRMAIPNEIKAENLTLAYYDIDQEEWIPLPTVIDLSTGVVTGLVEHFTKFAVLEKVEASEKTTGFIDVTHQNLPWAANEINYLADKGIVQGVGANRFAPASDITRAELTAIIVKALGLDYDTGYKGGFADISKDAWCKGYVQAAVDAGLVKGTSDETFGPNEVITREQLAVMMARIIPTDKDASGAGFKDAPEIASWAVDSVNRVVFLGLFNGFPDDSFRPKEPVSRAQAAVVIYRYLAGS